MAANTRFSVAVHLLAGLAIEGKGRRTSAELAESVNTNPAFLRRLLASLARAGLVQATSGSSGGSCLARDPSRITLREIYDAVSEGPLLALHANPIVERCPVSVYLRPALAVVIDQAEAAFLKSLEAQTLAGVLRSIQANTRS